jgi:hypothetical protein
MNFFKWRLVERRNNIGNESLNVDDPMETQIELFLECEKMKSSKIAKSSASTTYSVPKKSFKSILPSLIK